jgi:hypothetical protein
MRFRRKLGVVRVLSWVVIGAFLGASFVRQGYSYLAAGLAATLYVLVSLPSWLFWYWDVLPDRLIHRRYFGQKVLLFSEITYCGPVTGNAAGLGQTRHWIEIRTADGRRMIAQPADAHAFLAAMRRYLPAVTLNL